MQERFQHAHLVPAIAVPAGRKLPVDEYAVFQPEQMPVHSGFEVFGTVLAELYQGDPLKSLLYRFGDTRVKSIQTQKSAGRFRRFYLPLSPPACMCKEARTPPAYAA